MSNILLYTHRKAHAWPIFSYFQHWMFVVSIVIFNARASVAPSISQVLKPSVHITMLTPMLGRESRELIPIAVFRC